MDFMTFWSSVSRVDGLLFVGLFRVHSVLRRVWIDTIRYWPDWFSLISLLRPTIFSSNLYICRSHYCDFCLQKLLYRHIILHPSRALSVSGWRQLSVAAFLRAKDRLAGHVTFFNWRILLRIESMKIQFKRLFRKKKRVAKLPIPALSWGENTEIWYCVVPSNLSFAFCSAKKRLTAIYQISDHHFSGGYTVFHVWSPPVWNYNLLSQISLAHCTCFAMSHAPFVRLCRGFVGRQLVKPIVNTRNMASGRKNKILVTRSVPTAAIEIIKASERYVLLYCCYSLFNNGIRPV